MVEGSELAIARSGNPSLLKSALVIAKGAACAVNDIGVPKLGACANASAVNRRHERNASLRII
jgi:hypothetical protein